MGIQVKTANDMISDSLDAFFGGDEELAGKYFGDAIERKVAERFEEVLSRQPGISESLKGV